MNLQLDHNLEDNSLFQTHDARHHVFANKINPKTSGRATFKLTEVQCFFPTSFSQIQEKNLCTSTVNHTVRSYRDEGQGTETVQQ